VKFWGFCKNEGKISGKIREIWDFFEKRLGEIGDRGILAP